jgi:arginine exporter protein ArgO
VVFLLPFSQKISTSANNTSSFGAYFSALILTLMNPALIVSFAAIFAGSGIVYAKLSKFSTFVLIAGVFSGSAIWWVLLSGVASRLKTRFTDSFVRKTNHLSGVVIAGFGLFLVGSVLFMK